MNPEPPVTITRFNWATSKGTPKQRIATVIVEIHAVGQIAFDSALLGLPGSGHFFVFLIEPQRRYP